MTSASAPVRWLVTGAGGMLGRDLVAELNRAGEQVTAARHADLDITDATALRDTVAGHHVVVNAAAYTDVDAAESDETTATHVNGHGVELLARACAARGVRMIQISTDYVFRGDADRPYPEEAVTDPVNAYGRSKREGERAVLSLLPATGYVVRTAWLYGEHGRNFVATMLRLATERDTVDVVDDQHGQPTWTVALSRQLRRLGINAAAGQAPAGVYHGTASGQTTWYGLARAVFAGAGHNPDRVRRTTSDRFVRPARRPGYSVLGHDRWRLAEVPPQPDWADSLTEALRSWNLP
jgi:dTDP-4-dehydrorhamnose reductase